MTRVRRPVRRFVTALAAAAATCLPASTAVAQDPVEVSTHVTFPTAAPGGFQDADCAVENLSGESLLVVIVADVTYADGQVQRFHLNQPPTVLGPGETFILSIGFAVPDDAAAGTATFTCSVRAVGPAGGGFADADTSPFEVV